MLDEDDTRKAENVCEDQIKLYHCLDEVCLDIDQIEVLWLMYGEASNENKRYFIETFENQIKKYINGN